jgi:hypothetical protein
MLEEVSGEKKAQATTSRQICWSPLLDGVPSDHHGLVVVFGSAEHFAVARLPTNDHYR